MRALTVCLALLCPMLVAAQDVFLYDFEQGDDFATYEGLSLLSADAEIVAPGADGEGHCLKISTPEAARYCQVSIAGPIEVVKNLVLSFDYRATVAEGQAAKYVGILFFYADTKQFGRWDHKFSDEWIHTEVTLSSLSTSNEGVLEIGREFSRLNLYGRGPDEGADMTVWFDNIRLAVREPVSRVLERVETSQSNPPFLNWPRATGASRLQYSRSPDFPDDATTTVDTELNFLTPDRSLEAGRWYWRARVETELTDGWTDTHQVEIPTEAHRFTTPPVDAEAIMARPRPWLVNVEAERAKLDDAGIAALVSRAKSDYARGVPDDPPIWEDGDERWPAWIDWYRDIHGRTTSAMGARLERVATWAAITGDDDAYEWTREMALGVAAWDPTGGSAMRRGDIGAHHVLRGLNTAYDVLHDRISEDELATIRGAILARTADFWAYINPLRGNPYNNHAWLKTLVVGQAGLVLLGDHEEAYEWAEYSRQQFIGQYLCGLGYQGENNEGISYWSYGLSFIIEYAEMLRTVTGLDLFQQPWLNQTARFPMYCAPPNAWGVSFADTGKPNHSGRGPYATNYVGLLGENTGDPYALWYAGRREVVEGVDPRPPVDLPQSIHYSFIGLGIVNDSLLDGREGVTFAMHSGPYFAGHQHADQNAFVIHAYGEKLAIDSGYYDWYGSPHFKEYSLQTVAHNSVLVDGEGQAAVTKGADGRMAAYFESPGYAYMVGDASDPDVYKGRLTRFDRRVLMVRPGVIVMQDLLDAPESSSFDWLLHTVAPIEVDAASRRFAVTSGAARMTAQMLAPGDVAAEVTDRYPVHPYDGYGTVPVSEDKLAKEWHLKVQPTEPATQRDFLTVFDVRRTEDDGETLARPLNTQSGVGVLLTEGDRRTAVLLPDRDGARPLASGDLIADAEAAAVTVQGSRVTGFFAADARSLERAGQVLVKFDSGRGSVGALITAEGLLADLELSEAGMVTLLCPSAPATVACDDEVADVTWGADSRTLRLRVPAGQHTLRCGVDPAIIGSHPLVGVPMIVNGTETTIQGYARRVAQGFLRNWWGQVQVDEPGFHLLELTGNDAAATRVTWDGHAVELSEEATSLVWVGEGVHHLTIGAEGDLARVSLTRTGDEVAQSDMLPVDWELPEGALTFEAEEPSAESKVKATRTEKVAASGGLGHVGWDTDGMWAEWTLTVPAAGEYVLFFRGASIYADIYRELLLDGEALPGARIAGFQSTGGWCRTDNDWRWFSVRDVAGEQLVLNLKAGEHVLRMTRLEGSMNLDLIALASR